MQRALTPGACGARQAFTPEFRRAHPALTRYLQTLYGHPAALRALRRPLPAPEAELVPGEAALRAADGLPVQNPTRAPWSGARHKFSLSVDCTTVLIEQVWFDDIGPFPCWHTFQHAHASSPIDS